MSDGKIIARLPRDGEFKDLERISWVQCGL